MNFAIITAAGKGKRFGSNKALHPLHGKALIWWAVRIFQRSDPIDRIYVTYPIDNTGELYREMLQDCGPKEISFIKGGESRFESVRNAVLSIKEKTGIVLIHDAARPLASPELVSTVCGGAEKFGAAIPVLEVQETVKEIDSARIVRTLPRERIYLAQTPQGFKIELIMAAYRTDLQGNVTDESMLMEKIGHEVHVVPGEKQNLKITELSDLQLAEHYLSLGE
jgi:2-C-methyl-D-erythritol 4-phosphate cytidylyltransferase